MVHDSCYYSAKARYATFPSARASQAIAKCRKKSGHVRKSSAGSSLKRWSREKWKDTRTHRPCGAGNGSAEYCRPSKRVSSKTPTQYRGAKLRRAQNLKRSGRRANLK